ncbi:hypothetical protein BT63DRAFT_361994, partial [Microthyrium microscopicum]
CVAYCSTMGFSIAGTECAGQCFCGNTISQSQPISEAACNMPCEDDSSQICGGSAALSLFT